MGEHSHFVQFFRHDEELLESVCGFLGGGLLSGAACVVIATREHQAGLAQRLGELGLDLEAAGEWNQYVVLDAADTLDAILVDGWPDPDRFEAVIAPIIGAAGKRHPRVVAFGEMVSLLSQAGRADAAIELEKLWNALAVRHRFSLFCAYPMHDFDDTANAQAFLDICAQHSGVVEPLRDARDG